MRAAAKLPAEIAHGHHTNGIRILLAKQHHGPGCARMMLDGKLFREVESGHADFGVVPVENSTEGMVNHTLDCFMDSSLNICAEVELPIHHALMVNAASDGGGIQEIVSHSQSLAQCRSWLDAHYPGIKRTPVNSNAEAARLVSEDSPIIV